MIFVTIAGDFNGDGKVDCADFVAWRKGLGTTYTEADYDVWRTHFGQSIGGGSGSAQANFMVPEPMSIILCVVAVAFALLRHSRI
jgi:hypothetical protein